MAERTITVITEDGVDTHTEPVDANEHIKTLDLTPTKFIQEVTRKLKKEKD